MSNIMDVTNRRPIGITILAIIVAIQGAFELLGSAAAFVSFKGALATGVGIANLIFAFATLVLAWGLWTLKPWAFWATVVIEILVLVVRVFTLTQPGANLGSIILRMVLPICILIYLFADRHARAAFRK